MKYLHTAVPVAVRLLVLAAICVTAPARADEYGEVSQLLHAGKLAQASSKADGYLSSKPNDPQMRFLKGVIERNAGNQAEAIAIFTKLTQDYPELPEPYNNLAVLYAGQNQYDKARAALEMAIRTNPSYATAHENLGDVYARLASQAYNKALQLDGTNAAVSPKLAIIREVFKPNLNGYRPATPVPVSEPAKAPAAVPVAPAVVAANPPAAAPRPKVTPAQSSPPPIASKTTPTQPKASGNETKAVEATVHAWAKAWSAQDMTAYLGAYGKTFDPPGKQSRSAWELERRSRIVGKSSISVKLDHLTVKTDNAKAVAKFRQSYRSGSRTLSSRKTLDLEKSGERWLIVRESTENR